MLRTWTTDDGAFIHCADLAENLRKQAKEYDGETSRAFQTIAQALDAIETQTLRNAVEKLQRRPRLFF